MATSAQVRAWAAENGHPELAGGRGRIPDEVWAEFTAAHAPADDYPPGTGPDDFGGADDPGFVAADAPPSVQGAGAEEGEAAAAAEEDRPSRPSPGRFRFRFGRGRRPHAKEQKGKKEPPRPRRSFRRVSIAPMIEDAYSDLAWAAAGIPPLSRLLYAQAPIAGTVLDPVVQHTVADRVLLQPAARNYERVKVGMALLGTPAALLAVMATLPGPALGPDGQPLLVPVVDQQGQPVAGPDGQPVMGYQMAAATLQHKAAMVNLRLCVRAMADVGGDSMRRVRERAAENAERDDLVNEFIAFLLGVTVPEDAEETAARRARDEGLRLAGAAVE